MPNDQLLDQAGDLLRRGRAENAATLLAPVVQAQPHNVDAWHLLVRARLDLGEADTALEGARTALRLGGGLESLYLVSVAYSATGRHDLAIAAARTACAEDPLNPRLAERLGRALLAAGRVGEAVAGLEVAAEFAAYDADLLVAYGVALFASGRPSAARQAYGRALALEPTHVRAHTELRRLDVAERSIVDAASLVRVTDAFAESLRCPPGGRSRPDPGGAAAHVGGVLLVVSLVALVLWGAATMTGHGHAPQWLTLSLATVAVVGAGVRAVSR